MVGPNMATIDVSPHVKSDLEKIREEEQHRSYDSVVRSLVREYKTNGD